MCEPKTDEEIAERALTKWRLLRNHEHLADYIEIIVPDKEAAKFTADFIRKTKPSTERRRKAQLRALGREMAIRRLLEKGKSLTEAFEAVAKQRGISFEYVKRRYYEFKRETDDQ